MEGNFKVNALTCEKCGKPKTNTKVYTYYYGKKLSSQTVENRGNKTVTTKYAFHGSKNGILCEDCVVKAGIAKILWALTATLTGAAIALFTNSLHAGGANMRGLYAIVGVIGVITAVIGLFLLVMDLEALIGKKYGDTGSALLIRLHRKRFDRKVTDTFWTGSQYHKLQMRK